MTTCINIIQIIFWYNKQNFTTCLTNKNNNNHKINGTTRNISHHQPTNCNRSWFDTLAKLLRPEYVCRNTDKLWNWTWTGYNSQILYLNWLYSKRSHIGKTSHHIVETATTTERAKNRVSCIHHNNTVCVHLNITTRRRRNSCREHNLAICCPFDLKGRRSVSTKAGAQGTTVASGVSVGSA